MNELCEKNGSQSSDAILLEKRTMNIYQTGSVSNLFYPYAEQTCNNKDQERSTWINNNIKPWDLMAC
jgi:hypothetical protein